MSDNNWYSSESWYAPLKRAEAPDPAKREGKQENKKKKKVWPRVFGGIMLLLMLIVGSSYALRESAQDLPVLFPKASDKPADNGRDDGFFYSRGDEAEDGDDDADTGTDSDNDGMPDDWRDFFKNYYTTTETETVNIDMPRATVPIDAALQLSAADGEELSLSELYERCMRSVVGIQAYTRGRLGYSWGSGVIATADGLIITNTHVVNGCSKATVILYDDREFEATLVGADALSDIAVLKIEAEDLPAAVFGDSAALAVGDRVAAIGNPLGESFRMTLTDGIISAIARDMSYRGHDLTLLQTNAALNEGNSGGPLFNLYGQVVGITNMKMMSTASSIEGIGFAIPTSNVRTVFNSIVKNGEYRGRTSIGITVGAIPENAQSEYELPTGLMIMGVSEGSDAKEKGIVEGDVLTAVNGSPVTTTAEVVAIKDKLAVGDTMTLTIWHEGETRDVEIELRDTLDIYGG